MRLTSAFLALALLAFTASSSPVDTTVKRTHTESTSLEPGCTTPEPASAYKGSKDQSDTEFQNNPKYSRQAINRFYVKDYVAEFVNEKAASLVDNTKDHYKLTYLAKYKPEKCAKLCDEEKGFECKGFNIYFERDPGYKITSCPAKLNAMDSSAQCCTNPPSITQIKCVTLDYFPTQENAKNYGQYRNKFHVVIAGSNGYSKNEPVDA